jgi:hypothetical protein
MRLTCGNHALRCPGMPGKVCTVVPASGSRSNVQDHQSPAQSKGSGPLSARHRHFRADRPEAPGSGPVQGHQCRSPARTPASAIGRTATVTKSGRPARLTNGCSRITPNTRSSTRCHLGRTSRADYLLRHNLSDLCRECPEGSGRNFLDLVVKPRLPS